MRFLFFIILVSVLSLNKLVAQDYDQAELDSIRYAIVHLQEEVNTINYDLYNAKKTLKTGVFIATLGYTVTIIGGQLLGTKPKLGEALLYAGGAIGIGGTIVLVNGFNKIKLAPPNNK